MLNSIFASRAREHFGVPRGYVAASNPEAGLAPELVERDQAVVLFDGPHDVERWDVRSRHDELEVDYWAYGGEPDRAASTDADAEPAPKAGERFVILSIQRSKKVMPMHAGLSLETGDAAEALAEGQCAARGATPEWCRATPPGESSIAALRPAPGTAATRAAHPAQRVGAGRLYRPRARSWSEFRSGSRARPRP
jgi:hypothetical protein